MFKYANAAIILSLVSLMGWLLSIPILVSIIPGWTAIQFNTALGYLLSSIAVINLIDHHNKSMLIFNLFVFLLGGISLLDNWLPLNSGTWFFDQPSTPYSVEPGLMSVFASISLMLNAIFGLSVTMKTSYIIQHSIYIGLIYTLLIGTLFTLTQTTGAFTLIAIPTIIIQTLLILTKRKYLIGLRRGTV